MNMVSRRGGVSAQNHLLLMDFSEETAAQTAATGSRLSSMFVDALSCHSCISGRSSESLHDSSTVFSWLHLVLTNHVACDPSSGAVLKV